uniref:Uncharacterized protein n=1 Tax=Plectus sambesii TaxID=2011161 RepID=A0A914XCP1_9BILA
MMQLGFPDGFNGTAAVLSIIWSYQYICEDGYQTMLNNWICANRALDFEVPCKLEGPFCTQIGAYFACIGKLYSEGCNEDFGKMICRASGASFNKIVPILCDPKDFDSACDEGILNTGSLKAPYNTINAGSLNDHFYARFLSLFIALAVISLMHI